MQGGQFRVGEGGWAALGGQTLKGEREGGRGEGGGGRGKKGEEGEGRSSHVPPLPANPFHWTPPSAPEALSHRVWGPSSCPSKGPPTAARGGTKGGKKGVREERRGGKRQKIGGLQGGLAPLLGG